MADPQLRDLAERFFKGQDRLKGPLPPELLAPGYRAEIVGFPPMDAAAHGAFGQAFYAGFTVSAMVLLSVVKGRVTHLRGIFDQLGLMQQVGVVPQP